MKYIIITLLCIISISIGLPTKMEAQNPKKVKKLYEDFGYKTSIPLLEQIISKEGMKEADLVKIANSYRLIHDTENSEKWYKELVTLSEEPIHFLHYAQALQSNRKYDMAKKYFLLYDQTIGTTDNRGRLLADAIDRMNDFKQTDIQIKNESIINSNKIDFSPAFYKNGIVFVSTRPPSSDTQNKDIWLDDNFMTLFYTEMSSKAELGTPKEFSEKLSTEYHEGPLTANRKGDQIFFTRSNNEEAKRKNKGNTVRLNIYTAQKLEKEWGPASKLQFSTDEYDEVHPSLSSDNKSLYFSSNREGGFGGMDLYVCHFISGEWTEPANLGKNINSSGNEVFPFIHDDGTLYFSSDSWGGLGALDIFSTTKVEDSFWSKPLNIGTPFNSPKDDFGFILNTIGTEGYLSSARDGGKGLDDIYSFSLQPDLMKKPKIIRLISTLLAYDEKTGECISDVSISVIEGIRDESGFKMLDSYTLRAVPTDGRSDLLMVLQKTNADTIAGYTDITQRTNKSGEILYEMKPDREYLFFATKKGYHPGKLQYTTEGIKEPTTLSFSIPLTKVDEPPTVEVIEVGTVIALEKIYYDFDDYSIRPGASISLDQVVDLLRFYPSMHIELAAHTDSRGSLRYNKRLSIKRAESARKYIVTKGISSHRITFTGWGESRLRNNCTDGVDCTEEEHQYNRRTEITVTKFNRPDINIRYLNNPPEVIHSYKGKGRDGE